MDRIIDTVNAVLNQFERTHGRLPNTKAELDTIGRRAEAINDAQDAALEEELDEEEIDWMEA